MKNLFASNVSESFNPLMENALDITGAEAVEVKWNTSYGKPVLHVNVNGVCVLRVCRINNLFVQEAQHA